MHLIVGSASARCSAKDRGAPCSQDNNPEFTQKITGLKNLSASTISRGTLAAISPPSPLPGNARVAIGVTFSVQPTACLHPLWPARAEFCVAQAGQKPDSGLAAAGKPANVG